MIDGIVSRVDFFCVRRDMRAISVVDMVLCVSLFTFVIIIAFVRGESSTTTQRSTFTTGNSSDIVSSDNTTGRSTSSSSAVTTASFTSGTVTDTTSVVSSTGSATNVITSPGNETASSTVGIPTTDVSTASSVPTSDDVSTSPLYGSSSYETTPGGAITSGTVSSMSKTTTHGTDFPIIDLSPIESDVTTRNDDRDAVTSTLPAVKAMNRNGASAVVRSGGDRDAGAKRNATSADLEGAVNILMKSVGAVVVISGFMIVIITVSLFLVVYFLATVKSTERRMVRLALHGSEEDLFEYSSSVN